MSIDCSPDAKSSDVATFSQNDAFKPAHTSYSETLPPTNETQTLFTEGDFGKEEGAGADSRKKVAWTAADFRRNLSNLGLVLRNQKRLLAEENEFHADLCADLLGGLTENQLAWIGEIVGDDDPHLVEIKDIYAELRKSVDEYPSLEVQK